MLISTKTAKFLNNEHIERPGGRDGSGADSSRVSSILAVFVEY